MRAFSLSIFTHFFSILAMTTRSIYPLYGFILICAILQSSSLFAQQNRHITPQVQLRFHYGTDNEAIDHLFRFENIYMQMLHLRGADLKGKSYQLLVKEFKAKQHVKTDTLFDGTMDEYFSIKSDSLSFRFLCKTQDNTLRLQISTPNFSSRRLSYALLPSKQDYVLKDFAGAKPMLSVPIGKAFYLYAIIPPTIYPDGHGSYCNVAQSDTPPEAFGEKFNLEHYFLVEMVVTASTK
jgi:hypothetical protein